ncbi:type VI secretion system contractile sheath large subunit [Sphingomonas profundi]|uniref:type VI secretion system contractile sheath large subunit n=1 Tax=Alterirhizorhabdus profundi TaxID=2681549 RepID=UPI0012E95C8E|nr:type VI secretion system contractile sheath large subunit [Sphingomonas profundi]
MTDLADPGLAAGAQPLGDAPVPPAQSREAPPAGDERLPRVGGDPAAVRARANRLIVGIDALIGRQLDAVLHHPGFQRMEALWRGAWWLVESTADAIVKVRILDVRWHELARDMERAVAFDQNILFEKIYSGEFGTPGGEPFGMLVVDHALWHRPSGREKVDDIAAVSSLAEVAAAAFCPIVLGVDPRMIALDGYDGIDLRQDISGALTGPEHARFERLRAQPDCRFVAAVLPRLLMRQPYIGRSFPRLGFVYDEHVAEARDLLWASGAFGLAQVAARAMRVHRWPANIRGALSEDEGGVVSAPTRLFLPSDRRGVVARFATENAISEEQEMALNASGLICLRQLHLTGAVAFLNLPTLHRPPDYDNEAARMNAKMSAMLNYIMCVCRFAHYIKVMARDWVGKYTDANECQRLLQSWLNTYVTGNEDASPEMRVRYPLRQAAVQVEEVPGKPGTYTCEVAIRPHYQLDQIASEFRLVTAIGREVAA